MVVLISLLWTIMSRISCHYPISFLIHTWKTMSIIWRKISMKPQKTSIPRIWRIKILNFACKISNFTSFFWVCSKKEFIISIHQEFFSYLKVPFFPLSSLTWTWFLSLLTEKPHLFAFPLELTVLIILFFTRGNHISLFDYIKLPPKESKIAPFLQECLKMRDSTTACLRKPQTSRTYLISANYKYPSKR